MALVKCKECGKEVSDKAESCPNCGCPISKKKIKDNIQKVKVVKEKKVKKKLAKWLIVVVSILILGGISAFLIIREVHKSDVNRYKANLSDINSTMLVGAARAESVASLIREVWYNTIWEESDSKTDKYTKKNGVFYDDFNDSLANLFADEDFLNDLDFIKENQKGVRTLMKELKNPPKEFEDIYQDLKDAYDAYYDMTELAINPAGNLNTYTQNFSDADSDYVKSYQIIKDFLDE